MTDTETPSVPLTVTLGAPETNGEHSGTDKVLQALREPFPPEVIGILPKGKQVPSSEREFCPICEQMIGPHVHLSYVGWAAVVDRILTNDIRWTWDAYATDEDGLPKVRLSPNGLEAELWIRLTIHGVTRPGVGVVARDHEDLSKLLISDALKNAANKFGIALELWTKDELESLIGNQTVTTRRKPPRSSTSTKTTQSRRIAPDPASDGVVFASAKDRNRIVAYLAREHDPVILDPSEQLAKVAEVLGHELDGMVKLTASDALVLFDKFDLTPS